MRYIIPKTLNIVETNLASTDALTDNFINTQVERDGSFYVLVDNGLCDSIGLLNIEANSVKVELLDSSNNVVKEYNIDLRDEEFIDIWGYFYEDFVFKKDVFLEIILTYGLKVKITVDNLSNSAKLGKLIIGKASDYLQMLTSHSASFVDITESVTDANGNETKESIYKVKKLSATLIVERAAFGRTIKKLFALENKEALFVGEGGEHAIVYGKVQDFDGQYEFDNKVYIDLTIEGLR